MFAENIHNMARELIKAHGENPFDIAEGLGIKLILTMTSKNCTECTP